MTRVLAPTGPAAAAAARRAGGAGSRSRQIRHVSSRRDSRSHEAVRVIRRKTNRRHMTGDHHAQTAGRATLLVRAVGTILGTHSLLRPARPASGRCRRTLMPRAPAAGPRWGGERGLRRRRGYPWQRRTVTGERSSPAVSWLRCSCAAGAVKSMHVHQHMHFWVAVGAWDPGTPARYPGSRDPGMRQVARLNTPMSQRPTRGMSARLPPWRQRIFMQASSARQVGPGGTTQSQPTRRRASCHVQIPAVRYFVTRRTRDH